MRRLIISVLLLAAPVTVSAGFGGAFRGQMGAASSSGGSATCQSSPFLSYTTAPDSSVNVGADDNYRFMGNIYAPASAVTICKVDMYISSINGGTSRDWQVEIWDVDQGTGALTTKLGTSNTVATSAMTGSQYSSFTFVTPVSLPTSGHKYAIAVTPTDTSSNASNYINLGRKTGLSAGQNPDYGGWAAAHTLTVTDDTRVLNYKYYAYQ